MLNQEDIVIVRGLELSITRALFGEVIPSLRKVILKWEPGDEIAWIMFYHHGEVSAVIEEHYSCIATEVHADFPIDPEADFEVIRCDYPNPLPKEKYTIYARKEPFVDPQ